MSVVFVGLVVYCIIAVGIAPFDIHFKRPSRVPVIDEDEAEAVFPIFGLADGDPLFYQMGKIQMKPHTAIVYPNVYKTCLDNVKAVKPRSQKTSFLRLLTVHLVDPAVRVLSTANVTPSRLDWWQDGVWKVDDSVLSVMPQVIQDVIAQYVGATIAPAEAAKIRSKLVRRRRAYQRRHADSAATFESELQEE